MCISFSEIESTRVLRKIILTLLEKVFCRNFQKDSYAGVDNFGYSIVKCIQTIHHGLPRRQRNQIRAAHQGIKTL